MMAIERQVIVTWYTPEEKMPPQGKTVIITISGHGYNIDHDHVLGIAKWQDDYGWVIYAPDVVVLIWGYTVHAWCDLDPYGVSSAGWSQKPGGEGTRT